MTVREGTRRAGVHALSQAELAAIARRVADQPELWQGLVRFETSQRWYVRLEQGAGYEVWLLKAPLDLPIL